MCNTNRGLIRPDFIFSYWIVGWFMMWVSFEPYIVNPLFALIMASSYVILTSFTIVSQMDITTLYAACLSNLAIKGIPIVFMCYKMQCNISQREIVFTAFLFIVYNGWLYIHGQTFLTIYTEIYDGLHVGEPVDGVTVLVKWIIQNYFKQLDYLGRTFLYN